jgi:quaternary ammonium compound-resistance protein SugE
VAWIYLVFAGVLEIVWSFYMKKSEGFTLIVPTVVTLVTMIASFALLSLSMKTLPLGTAYTIWTGIGAVGAFVLGIALLGEALTPTRLIAAGLILAGIVMLKLTTPQGG